MEASKTIENGDLSSWVSMLRSQLKKQEELLLEMFSNNPILDPVKETESLTANKSKIPRNSAPKPAVPVETEAHGSSSSFICLKKEEISKPPRPTGRRLSKKEKRRLKAEAKFNVKDQDFPLLPPLEDDTSETEDPKSIEKESKENEEPKSIEKESKGNEEIELHEKEDLEQINRTLSYDVSNQSVVIQTLKDQVNEYKRIMGTQSLKTPTPLKLYLPEDLEKALNTKCIIFNDLVLPSKKEPVKGFSFSPTCWKTIPPPTASKKSKKGKHKVSDEYYEVDEEEFPPLPPLEDLSHRENVPTIRIKEAKCLHQIADASSDLIKDAWYDNLGARIIPKDKSSWDILVDLLINTKIDFAAPNMVNDEDFPPLPPIEKRHHRKNAPRILIEDGKCWYNISEVASNLTKDAWYDYPGARVIPKDKLSWDVLNDIFKSSNIAYKVEYPLIILKNRDWWERMHPGLLFLVEDFWFKYPGAHLIPKNGKSRETLIGLLKCFEIPYTEKHKRR